MALFKIDRPMGRPVTSDEIEAIGLRAAVCMVHFPGMTWHRSFLDRATWTFQCIYEADNADEIREHARIAQIPCVTVTPVEEFTPAPFA